MQRNNLAEVISHVTKDNVERSQAGESVYPLHTRAAANDHAIAEHEEALETLPQVHAIITEIEKGRGVQNVAQEKGLENVRAVNDGSSLTQETQDLAEETQTIEQDHTIDR